MNVLVTRPREKAAALCDALLTAGLEPVFLPAIETVPVEDTSALDAALRRLAEYRWIVFTSGTAARLFCARAGDVGVDLGASASQMVAGPATAETLKEGGGQAGTVVSPFSAERVLERLRPFVRPGDAALLLRPEQGLDTLARGLQAWGARVDQVALYRTVASGAADGPALDTLRRGALGAVTFFSPSAVHSLESTLEASGIPTATIRALKADIPAACIGPTTAAAASSAGWQQTFTPAETTAAALVEALVSQVRREAVAC